VLLGLDPSILANSACLRCKNPRFFDAIAVTAMATAAINRSN